MGPFYAYLKDANSDSSDRYVITFASRETADEWWRMISTSPSPFIGAIKRISPQFYADDRSTINLRSSFFHRSDLPGAKQFMEKMFFTSISNSLDPIAIPLIEVTDHISGRWYFIRSKADPWSYWYFRTGGACLVCGDANCNAIHVSSEHRSKFCVQVRYPVLQNFVMIGGDEISITAGIGHIVHISDASYLMATNGHQGETDFLLDDLKDRFIARAEKQINGEMWEYVEVAGRGVGEAWELVG